MPRIGVVIFQEDVDTVPLLAWLDTLPARAQDRCRVRIERLRELGHELRRPEADFVRDGIYELRIGLQRMNYRILYFFHGKTTAVLSHGLVKEQIIPPEEISRAIARKQKFERDPHAHTYRMA